MTATTIDFYFRHDEFDNMSQAQAAEHVVGRLISAGIMAYVDNNSGPAVTDGTLTGEQSNIIDHYLFVFRGNVRSM